ncbi:MAG: hypothetical protein AAFO29_03345, partial [Actinomycetota bacterium]
LVPGQGFLDGGTLIQVACLAPAEDPGAVAKAESELAAADDSPLTRAGARDRAADRQRQRERERLVELAERLAGRVDPALVTAPLPRRVPMLTPAEHGDPLRPLIGQADLTGQPYELDLRHANLSIVGDPRSGRSTALAAIGRQVVAAGAELWVLASPGSPLVGLAEASRSCGAEGEERAAFLEELVELAADTTTGSASAQRVLLVDDHDLLPENDRAVTGPLEQLLTNPSIRWAAAGAKSRGFSASPVAQAVKSARSIVYLRPHDAREAQEVIGVPAPWHPGLPMVEGRGLVVVDRLPTIVQFSDPELVVAR